MSKQRGLAQDIASKAQEVVVDDANKARSLLKEAVQSRAYLYPIKVSTRKKNSIRTKQLTNYAHSLRESTTSPPIELSGNLSYPNCSP
jgi:hypothetical protein